MVRISNPVWTRYVDIHIRKFSTTFGSSSHTRVLNSACILASKRLTRSLYFKSRIPSPLKSHISTTIKSRVSTTIKSRVSLALRAASHLHWSSRLYLISVTTVSVRTAFSHTYKDYVPTSAISSTVYWQVQSITPPVQQYTDKQIIAHDKYWVFKTLMMIFPGGFKQVKPKFNQNLKYFEIHPSQSRSIKNFEGGSVGCQKITKDKSSDANLTLTRRSRFKLKCGPHV